MKEKILILGSTGLIGHQIFEYFDNKLNYEVFNCSRTSLNENTILLNALNFQEVEKTILEIKPQFVINCIGILIEGSNNNPKMAEEINGIFPNLLAEFCKKLKVKLIHISTDCVFSGKKGNYSEFDKPDSPLIYGKTKAQGEIIDKNHCTIRTSVIGPEINSTGNELFDWFMSQSGSVNGYTRSIWSGVTTLELAKMVDCAIILNINNIYNFSSKVAISKYKLLCKIKKIFSRDIVIEKIDGVITNKSLIDNRCLINFNVPKYDIMISDMLEKIKINQHKYPYYEKYIN